MKVLAKDLATGAILKDFRDRVVNFVEPFSDTTFTVFFTDGTTEHMRANTEVEVDGTTAEMITHKGGYHRRLVEPSKEGRRTGWCALEEIEWPAEAIHEMRTSGGKNVTQFIAFNRSKQQYELRSWRSSLLVTAGGKDE